MEDQEKTLKILSSKERTYEELEWLSSYLFSLEDYRSYARNLSQVLLIHLSRCLTATFVTRKQTVFLKGDNATTWYIVFDGELEIYHTLGSESKLINRIIKGKQIGEFEVLKDKNYSTSCFPSKNSWLLSLSRKDFMSLLSSQLNARLALMRNFVSSYLPHLHGYSWNFKEKIGYLFSLSKYKRGETIVGKDFLDDKLYFVFEGEVGIYTECENKMKNIVKLCKGMCFAEECTLMNKPCLFNIKILSEKAVIASINQSDISMLPDETLASLKSNLQDKVKSRKTLLPNQPSQPNSKSTYPSSQSPAFKSANRQAREQLIKYILRNKPCTPKRILSLSRVKNRHFKEQLEVMRDCNPQRLRCASGFGTIKKIDKKREKSLPFL